MNNVYELIKTERERQLSKLGIEQHHNNLYWLGILMEEVGAVAKSIIEYNFDPSELVQVAAVAVTWLEDWMRDK